MPEPVIARTTYQSIIRSYSRMVESGASDTDLNKRERKLVSLMLNLASNHPMASAEFPIADNTRDLVVRRLGDMLSDASWLVYAVSPSSEDDFRSAWERTIAILRGV